MNKRLDSNSDKKRTKFGTGVQSGMILSVVGMVVRDGRTEQRAKPLLFTFGAHVVFQFYAKSNCSLSWKIKRD
jgi:hypothetical protein